jgi:tRNA modification GTPase
MQKPNDAHAALGSARQKKACVEALDSVRHALRASEGFTLDAAVADVEDALYFLSEITGTVTPEDILDTVFSQFCLGK